MISLLKDHGTTQMQLTALELNLPLPIAHTNQDHIVHTLKMFMFIVLIELIYKNISKIFNLIKIHSYKKIFY